MGLRVRFFLFFFLFPFSSLYLFEIVTCVPQVFFIEETKSGIVLKNKEKPAYTYCTVHTVTPSTWEDCQFGRAFCCATFWPDASLEIPPNAVNVVRCLFPSLPSLPFPSLPLSLSTLSACHVSLSPRHKETSNPPKSTG